jgi:hypothetical protein
MKAMRLSLLVVGFIAVTYFLSSYGLRHFKAQSQTSLTTTCCDQREGLRELDFPYYSLREGFASQLYLVSATDQTMDVTLTVYGQHGASVLSAVTIQPNAKLAIDLRAFLTQHGADVAGEFGEGSVAVYFEGTMMPVAGQVTVSNAALRLAHEAEALENDPGRTDIPSALNSAWWNLAPGRDARVMVANMSPNSVTADVYLDYLGERHPSAPLTFVPHELKVLSITQLLGEQNTSPAQAPAGGITIVQRGDNPRLAAQGKILDATTGFSTTMHFPSPQLGTASALHAVGIPVGKPSKDSPFAGLGYFTPHVVMRNLLGTPQTAVVTVEYPSVPGWNSHAKRTRPDDQSDSSEAAASSPGDFTGQLPLAPLTVGSYSTQDVSLDSVLGQLPQPLPYVSIRIQHSGAPGSMVAEVSSVEEQKDLVMDAKVQNEGNGWAGSGGNPWHLDKDTESYEFLTNMGEKPVRIGFKVWADGQIFYLGSLELVPHETRMIDLRKLRDAQETDLEKHRIPAGATDGSVLWLRLDNVPVMGRLAVITRHGGMASSYDCCLCGCPGQYNYTVLIPVITCPITVAVGDQVHAQVWYSPACGGTYYYYDMTTSLGWSSTNPGIFTLSNNPQGLLRSVAVGTATALAQGTTACQAWYQLGAVCQCSSWVTILGNTPCSVQNPSVTVSCSPLNLALGSTAPADTKAGNCNTTASPAGGTFSWSVNKGTVTLSPSGGGASYTAASQSSPSGDTIITVTYTVNTQSATAQSAGITVRQPTSLSVNSDTTNPSGKWCSVDCLAHPGDGTCRATFRTCSYISYLRQRQYSVLDQFGNKFENVGLSSVVVTESVPFTTTCQGLVQPVLSGLTSPFNDSYFLCHTCCLPNGPGCSAQTNPLQTIFVNGVSVRQESITWTCTGVTVSP